jgi:accessory colonization factor AcfC
MKKRTDVSCGIALTQQGKDREVAKRFFEFLKTEDGAKIFAKWGWITSKKR